MMHTIIDLDEVFAEDNSNKIDDQEERLKNIISGNPMVYLHLWGG